MRQVINDAMDVHGGRGVCIGPSNYLARAYQSIPISITVEGANILTRSLIIFGQGADALSSTLNRRGQCGSLPNQEEGLRRFDEALFKHLGYAVSNGARSFLYGLTRSRLAPSPLMGLLVATLSFGANECELFVCVRFCHAIFRWRFKT